MNQGHKCIGTSLQTELKSENQRASSTVQLSSGHTTSVNIISHADGCSGVRRDASVEMKGRRVRLVR